MCYFFLFFKLKKKLVQGFAVFELLVCLGVADWKKLDKITGIL